MAVKKTKKKVSKAKLSPQDELLISTARKAMDFLDLAPKKKIAIIADNDEDGVTSAAQMKLFLESQKVEVMVFFYDHYSRGFSYPKQEFLRFNPEKTVFLDLSDGFVSDILSELGNAVGPFLVIDHHQREVIHGNAFKSIVIKPSTFSKVEPSKYPVSRMVFDLFGGKEWVCSIGIIGDSAQGAWAAFIEKTQKKYKLSKKKFFALADIVTCTTSQYSEKMNSLLEFLCTAKSPKELLKSEYYSLMRLYNARLKVLKEVFYKECQCFDDAQVCFFKCDNRFSSKLSNIISAELPAKTVVIYEQPAGMMKASIRRQDFMVNCGELAKFSTRTIPESKGGGHIPAAGASFPPEHLELFKKNVRHYLLMHPPKLQEQLNKE